MQEYHWWQNILKQDQKQISAGSKEIWMIESHPGLSHPNLEKYWYGWWNKN